jgi:PPK2 family polyphosphate:nucleotide phosphotransferase
MKINSKDFRVRPGEKVKLREWPTVVKPFCKSKKRYQKLLEEHVEELSSLQRLHYASNRYALLLIFQGMDAAGKDGAIRHVMSGVNPQGCEVFSFKQPSAEELEHDFLWRTTCRLPERGRIGIFNRSYYEEVLVVRVHPEILRSQGLPEELLDEKTIWKERYRSIVDLEEHLHRNGTRIIKFFLHLSKDEQRKRFLERIDEPDKNWKFSLADIHERKYWKHYMKAYEACLNATSTHHAPWYVVPADDKENARLIVSQIVLDALNELKMAYPKTTAKRRRELKSIRVLYFGLRLAIAPDRVVFLKRNWLFVLAILVPILRFFPFLQTLPLARALTATFGMQVIWMFASADLGLRSLRRTMGRRGTGYVLTFTVVVILAGAAGMLHFENDSPDPQGIHSYPKALWWVAMQITNIGSGYRPVTVGGHVLCLGISIFALAIFGYLTAVFAAFFIGRDAEDPKSEIPNQTSILQLSAEVALLRRSIDDVLRRVSDAAPRSAEPPPLAGSRVKSNGETCRGQPGSIQHEIKRQRSINRQSKSAHAQPAGDFPKQRWELNSIRNFLWRQNHDP